MDFKLIVNKLIGEFDKKQIQYALIGGFALGLWGINRATVDIDFLVNKEDMKKVYTIMTGLDYKCVFKTENVSQYLSALSAFGEVDFLHAFRETSLVMLARAKEQAVFDNTLRVKVLIPEDLIGLKIQAMANNKSRWDRDLWDIEEIMARYKSDLNWSLIEEYFALFGLEDKAQELKGKYLGNE